MISRIFVFGVLVWAAVSQSAQAGLLIEPYVGYGHGEQEVTISGSSIPGVNGTSKIDGNGPYYGGRLGYAFPWVVFGGEYSAGSIKLGGEKTDHHEILAFAGVRFPVLVNLLLGYVVSNDADGTGGDGGYKATLQFRALPLVNINLEYFVSKYKGLEPEPAGPSAGMTSKSETKGYGISVSLPLEI